MNTIIRTKWGQLTIDAASIYEVNTHINPWNNSYVIEFIMEGSYQRLPTEFQNMDELLNTLRSIVSDLNTVKQYKYKAVDGSIQVDEKRRLRIMKERK